MKTSIISSHFNHVLTMTLLFPASLQTFITITKYKIILYLHFPALFRDKEHTHKLLVQNQIYKFFSLFNITNYIKSYIFYISYRSICSSLKIRTMRSHALPSP